MERTPLWELKRLEQITGTAVCFDEEHTTDGRWTVHITFGSHTARSTGLNKKRQARQQAARDIIDELTRSGELQEIEAWYEERRRPRNYQDAMYTQERRNASHYIRFRASDPNLLDLIGTNLNHHNAVGINTKGRRDGHLPTWVQICTGEITNLICLDQEFCERGAQYPIQLQHLFQNPNIVKYVFDNDDYLGPAATNVIYVQRLAMESPEISLAMLEEFGRPLGQPPSLVEVASIVKYLYQVHTNREPKRMTQYINDPQLTHSDWYARELTMEQCRYLVSQVQLTRICAMFIPRLQAYYANVEARLI